MREEDCDSYDLVFVRTACDNERRRVSVTVAIRASQYSTVTSVSLMRKFCTPILSIGFALVVSFAQPLFASTVIYRTDAQLVALSERVVHARVVAQRTTRGGADGLTIYTVTTLSVLEDFTGQAGDTLEVWELGGVVGDEILYVGGAVAYTVGREVLVCLERGPYGWRSIAMGFSKFDLMTGPRGVAQLTRNLRDTAIVGGRAPTSERTLDEFRTPGRERHRAPFASCRGRGRRRGVCRRSVYACSRVDGAGSRRMPARRFPGIRTRPPLRRSLAGGQRNPDCACRLDEPRFGIHYPAVRRHYVATDGQGAVVRHTGWQRRHHVRGSQQRDSRRGACYRRRLGQRYTRQWWHDRRDTFVAFTRGFVIFQNAADLPAEFTKSLGFTRVLEHEIGHAIGLGHTDDDSAVLNPEANIMNSACCYPETPVPPALGADDLAGLNFIYPSNLTGPQMALDKSSLKFGAVTNGASLLSQT